MNTILLRNWGDKMYLSRVQLDVTKREVMRALNSPSIIHGAVENCFSGERKRNLWRIDSLGGKLYVLILSENAPDLTGFCRQFGVDECGETRSYDKLLDRIENGVKLHFRLKANPTVSRKEEAGKRGKVYAHVTPEFQKMWLTEKAEKNGFSLNDEDFEVVYSKRNRFYKGGDKKVYIVSAEYEGILYVTDKEAFKNMLISGIGRGKAYGMGLMTVVFVN